MPNSSTGLFIVSGLLALVAVSPFVLAPEFSGIDVAVIPLFGFGALWNLRLALHARRREAQDKAAGR